MSIPSTHTGQLASLVTLAPGSIMAQSGLSEHLHISVHTYMQTHTYTKRGGGPRNLVMKQPQISSY